MTTGRDPIMPMAQDRERGGNVPTAARFPESLMRDPMWDCSVVCVDDDHLARTVLERLVASRVRELTMVETGQAALDLLTTHRPDILITDICMPAMDGFMLAEEIKRSLPDLPVIAVTGVFHADLPRATAEHGMDGVVLKPINASMLFDALNRCARLAHAVRDAALLTILESQAFDTWVFTDQSARIVRVSMAGAALLGRTPESLIGRPFADVLADQRTRDPSSAVTLDTVPVLDHQDHHRWSLRVPRI